MENKVLLSELHKAQEKEGYVSWKSVEEIAQRLSLPAAEVYQTASFYSLLYLEPQGSHVIEICESAPCHVAGAGELVETLEARLGIRMGETTADKRFTLRFIQCCGQCQDAPVLRVDGKVYPGMDAIRAEALLNRLSEEDRI